MSSFSFFKSLVYCNGAALGTFSGAEYCTCIILLNGRQGLSARLCNLYIKGEAVGGITPGLMQITNMVGIDLNSLGNGPTHCILNFRYWKISHLHMDHITRKTTCI